MTIKETAGKILLLLYVQQRLDPARLSDSYLSFQMRHFSNPSQTSPVINQPDDWLVKLLHAVTETDADIYNALHYLDENSFISFSESSSNLSDSYMNIRVLNHGVDVIEGIEQGAPEKKRFGVVFNISVKNEMNVDSLVKAEIGNIVGVGGAIKL